MKIILYEGDFESPLFALVDKKGKYTFIHNPRDIKNGDKPFDVLFDKFAVARYAEWNQDYRTEHGLTFDWFNYYESASDAINEYRKFDAVENPKGSLSSWAKLYRIIFFRDGGSIKAIKIEKKEDGSLNAAEAPELNFVVFPELKEYI